MSHCENVNDHKEENHFNTHDYQISNLFIPKIFPVLPTLRFIKIIMNQICNKKSPNSITILVLLLAHNLLNR